MFENLKNRVKGIATEKQGKDDNRKELHWRRDARGNMVDEFGHPVAKNLEAERSGRRGDA